MIPRVGPLPSPISHWRKSPLESSIGGRGAGSCYRSDPNPELGLKLELLSAPLLSLLYPSVQPQVPTPYHLDPTPAASPPVSSPAASALPTYPSPPSPFALTLVPVGPVLAPAWGIEYGFRPAW